MLECYLQTPDGKEYIDVNCVKEALGIVDEDMNIFRVIKKLREDNDLLREKVRKMEQNLVISRRLSKEDRDFIDDVCEAIGIQRPHIENDYDKAVRLIAEIKSERDRLKEKCDKLKARTNALYGTSCGYSGNKAPALLCHVISYSCPPWCAAFTSNSVRVELDLTPTANHNGTLDLEDLKRYIEAYGREKKLGIIESVDYQNAKAARAELAYLYKKVLGKEKLDMDLSPHEVMKAILDEYDRREEFIRELSCSLGFGNPVVTPDSIDQKEKDILERVEGLKAGVWPCENSSTFAEYLRKEFPKFCKEYNVAPLTEGGSVRDWIQYIFGVLTEHRERYNSEWKWVEQLKKEKRTVVDSLSELRAKVREIYEEVFKCGWEEGQSYVLSLNDINEEYKRVVHNFEERTADWNKVQQELDRYRLAVGSLCNIPAEHRDDISWIEDAFNHTKKDYLKWKTTADKLCKDYTEFRKTIWEAMGRKPETLPEDDARLVGEVAELAHGEKLLIEFRDDVARAIGITYPTTNNFIVKGVEDIYKERGEAHDLAMELDRKCIDLTAKNSDLQQKFQFQSGLRQQWHARYESEHERANGVQKALDREREKCRVKDVSLETAKKQYEKVCGDLETAECAINGMKGKVRSLREEKTKVISALGQDIWDDCLK